MPKVLEAQQVVESYGLTKDELLRMYFLMYISREIDRVQELWMRGGKSHFFISSAGHEAFEAGVSLSLRPEDWMVLYYRNLCLALAQGMTPREILAASINSMEDPGSKGKQLPNHYGKPESRIFTRSSPVGTQFLTGAGMGFGTFSLQNLPEEVREKHGIQFTPGEIVVVGAGEGATSQGEFWEALNFSGNKHHPCPVLYLIEDNKWAISVHVSEQTAGGCVADLLTGFASKGLLLLRKVKNGLDPIQSALAAKDAIDWVRTQGKPAVLYVELMRKRSHSIEDNEQDYQPKEVILEKELNDPLRTYPEFLISEGIATAEEIKGINLQIRKEVDVAREALEEQFEKKTVVRVSKEEVLRYVYAEERSPTSSEFDRKPQPEGDPLMMFQALNRCLHDEFEKDPLLWGMGEDCGDVSLEEYLDVVPGKGGVFKVTLGLQKRFGRHRFFNSPLAEQMIAGIAYGAATRGVKGVVEIQFSDYAMPAMHYICQEIATLHWRSHGGWKCPLVIRMASQGYTGGIGSIWHSQSNEIFFAAIPGIHVVMPSTPAEAVGLLRTAIRCDDPVIFLEPKSLYRRRNFLRGDPGEESLTIWGEPIDRLLESEKQEVLVQVAEPYPGSEYTIPFGKARIVRSGEDLTCVTWGVPVHFLTKVCNDLATEEGSNVELIDLRSLRPLDYKTISQSVTKTGRLLIVHGAQETYGPGKEIAAWVQKDCFDSLDAPIEILGAEDCPVGAGILEYGTLPQPTEMKERLLKLARY